MENFEQNSQINPEENMRNRVDELREDEKRDDDSIHDLALEENEYRKELGNEGVNKVSVDKLANLYSNQVLEKIENQKAKFKDSLTKIGNRGAFDETIPPILNIERREKKDSAILMIDIDFFKQVNDKHGHDVGDKTLKEIVNIIKNTIRTSDIVFRVGGEEFAVFLPDTDVKGSKIIADKIRENVEKVKIYNRTVSIGCMGTDQSKVWSKGQDKPDMQKVMSELKKGSDQALYYSKEHGRNQVTLFTEEVEKYHEEKEVERKIRAKKK